MCKTQGGLQRAWNFIIFIEGRGLAGPGQKGRCMGKGGAQRRGIAEKGNSWGTEVVYQEAEETCMRGCMSEGLDRKSQPLVGWR